MALIFAIIASLLSLCAWCYLVFVEKWRHEAFMFATLALMAVTALAWIIYGATRML